jgi:uncharacterized protein (UPF0276 family)
MNEIVENLKIEKDQIEYKLQQYENQLECQKLEIESKSSLLKQFDFVIYQFYYNTISNNKTSISKDFLFKQKKIQDMTNELTNIKLAQNSVTSQLKNKPHVEYRLITLFFRLFL